MYFNLKKKNKPQDTTVAMVYEHSFQFRLATLSQLPSGSGGVCCGELTTGFGFTNQESFPSSVIQYSCE